MTFFTVISEVIKPTFPFPLYRRSYSLCVHQPVSFSQNWVLLSISHLACFHQFMTLLVGHPLHKKEFTIPTNLTPLMFYTQAVAFGTKSAGVCINQMIRTLNWQRCWNVWENPGLQQLIANSTPIKKYIWNSIYCWKKTKYIPVCIYIYMTKLQNYLICWILDLFPFRKLLNLVPL